MKNLRFTRSGFPDLIVWNTDTQQFKVFLYFITPILCVINLLLLAIFPTAGCCLQCVFSREGLCIFQRIFPAQYGDFRVLDRDVGGRQD